MTSWIWRKHLSWFWILGKIVGRWPQESDFPWKKFSQEWKCNGKPKKLHCWVASNLWSGLTPDFWSCECVQDCASLYQSDLSIPLDVGKSGARLYQRLLSTQQRTIVSRSLATLSLNCDIWPTAGVPETIIAKVENKTKFPTILVGNQMITGTWFHLCLV